MANAQSPIAPVDGNSSPRWLGHFTVLAGNATIGGLTAGVFQEIRGGSFTDGFVRGFLGGSVVYWGKHVASLDLVGAGIMGREIAAVGSSVVRNASEGRGTLARLYLPLGPLPGRIVLVPNGFDVLTAQLDVAGAGLIVQSFLDSRVKLDVENSLSSGAPVFQVNGRRLVARGNLANGAVAYRTIFLSDPATEGPPIQIGPTLRHERVHVLQQDFVLTAWSDMLQSTLGNRAGIPRLTSFLSLDVLGWAPRALRRLLYSQDNWNQWPLELEAEFLAR